MREQTYFLAAGQELKCDYIGDKLARIAQEAYIHSTYVTLLSMWFFKQFLRNSAFDWFEQERNNIVSQAKPRFRPLDIRPLSAIRRISADIIPANRA